MVTKVNSLVLGNAEVHNYHLNSDVFGSVAGKAVEGNKTLTLVAAGDLSGGGTITLGSGGTLNISYSTPTVLSAFSDDIGLAYIGNGLSIFVDDVGYALQGSNISGFNNDAAYVTSGSNISLFVNDAGYLTSFTETDPTVPAHVKSITNTQKTNWNTAYSWGNHASVGYLTTETDPTVPAHVKSITTTEKTNWNTAYGWGNHASVGYLTSAPNDYVDALSFNTTNGVLTVGRTGTLPDLTVDLDGRYLQSYSETDTLQTVTTRGNTTTNAITLSNVTITGDLTVSGNTTTINATELAIEDNLIYLNDGSTATNPDLGWVGNYNDGTYAHAGMFRDSTDGRFKVFKGYTPEPGQTIDTAHASFSFADFQAGTVYANLSGNATTATSASKWTTARTLSLTGDATGSVSIDGSANASISVVIADDSHNHIISNVDGLQALLDTKWGKGTDIPSGADLNTYTTDGYYHQNANANAAAGTNYPVALAGMLEVTSDGSMVYQRYTVYNSEHSVYVRTYYNGTWYTWYEMWHSGNDGTGSGLDADLLDGQQGSYYLDWNNVTNKPDPVITINLAGDVTGTGTTTWTDLASGTLTIDTTVTVSQDSVELGVDTVGNYVSVVEVSGNGLGIIGNASENAVWTVTSNAVSTNTANTLVYRDASGNFSAGVITATATQARYADLAEKYTVEFDHPVGTVMMVSYSGNYEIEPCQPMGIPVGIVSENPAYLMNESIDGQAIALKGRVPVRVIGQIRKGEAVYAHRNGCASTEFNGACIVGVALESSDNEYEKLIECVIKV